LLGNVGDHRQQLKRRLREYGSFCYRYIFPQGGNTEHIGADPVCSGN